MPRAANNPDRDFSADPIDEREARALRDLLKRSETASIRDEIVRKRVGQAIGRARPQKDPSSKP